MMSSCSRSTTDPAQEIPAELVLPEWTGPSSATLALWAERDARTVDLELGGELGRRFLSSRRAILHDALDLPLPGEAGEPPPDAESLARSYAGGLEAWAAAEGPEAFHDMGAAVWREFRHALEAGIAASQRAGLPVLEWVASNPEEPTAIRFASWTGDYFFAAERFRVRAPDGSALRDAGTERLLFEDWWTAQLRGSGRISVTMPEAVERDLLLFRLLAVPDAPIDAQMRWINQLQRDHGGLDGRPVTLVRAAAMMRSRQFREARMAVEAASSLPETRREELLRHVDRAAAR